MASPTTIPSVKSDQYSESSEVCQYSDERAERIICEPIYRPLALYREGCQPERMTEKPRPQPEVSTDPSQGAVRLVNMFIPKTAPISQLQGLLLQAQSSPPADKVMFVENVNRLLETFRLRVQAEDGGLYKLRVAPGATGRGHVQLGNTGKNRGFKNALIRVVPLEI